jgi:N-acetylmuramoyl-L-alanine amidase
MNRWRAAGRAFGFPLLALVCVFAVGSGLSESLAGGSNSDEPAACDRAHFRLLLDVGHSPEVPGAMSARGLTEFRFNLRLVKDIDQAMIDAGFEHTEARVTQGAKQISLTNRVAHANHSAPDVFLSIHHDSVPDSLMQKWEYEGKKSYFNDRFKGHSIFVSWDNPARAMSLRFARLLGLALKERGLSYTPHYTQPFMGRHQRQLVDSEAGVYRFDQLRVLHETHMPAVLLEAGLIVNREEELLLDSAERRALIGAAVVDAAEVYCAALPRRQAQQTKR